MRILVLFCMIVYSPALFGLSDLQFAGKTLEEALRELQSEGLNILFSSDLVRPEMKVSKEPTATSEIGILAQLVSPHGLRVQPGPQNTLLVVRGSTASTQNAPAENTSPGGSETVVVPFVSVYFTARDHVNRPVRHLKAKDFLLHEDGKKQSLVELTNSADRQPLTVLFLLDSSHSMQALQDGAQKYEVSKQALLRVADELQQQDQMMVIGFHERSWTITEMSKSPEVVRRNVSAAQAGPARTALYDALVSTIKLAKPYPGRKIIILCSDGEDNFSKSSLTDVLALLKSTDITIMAFGTTTKAKKEQHSLKALKDITEVSGGFAFISSRITDLDSVIGEFRSVMDSQYVAGYVPPDPLIHKRREVRIFCLVPGVQLHYRKSYLF